MPFKPLVTAGIENVLNAFLYRAPALKAARQRLNGKVLRIVLKEFSTPLVLVFSERQLDVWVSGKVNPTVRSSRT